MSDHVWDKHTDIEIRSGLAGRMNFSWPPDDPKADRRFYKSNFRPPRARLDVPKFFWAFVSFFFVFLVLVLVIINWMVNGMTN